MGVKGAELNLKKNMKKYAVKIDKSAIFGPLECNSMSRSTSVNCVETPHLPRISKHLILNE